MIIINLFLTFKIDISEGIDINKTSELKECIIC